MVFEIFQDIHRKNLRKMMDESKAWKNHPFRDEIEEFVSGVAAIFTIERLGRR